MCRPAQDWVDGQRKPATVRPGRPVELGFLTHHTQGPGTLRELASGRGEDSPGLCTGDEVKLQGLPAARGEQTPRNGNNSSPVSEQGSSFLYQASCVNNRPLMGGTNSRSSLGPRCRPESRKCRCVFHQRGPLPRLLCCVFQRFG